MAVPREAAIVGMATEAVIAVEVSNDSLCGCCLPR